MIRTILLRLAKNNNFRTILVTSALPGEGKTFVSSNLAVTLAKEVTNNVILVDIDVRNSSLCALFGLSKEKTGLSSYFSKNIKISDVSYNTGIPNLTIIPSGQFPEKPSEVISREKIGRLLSAIKSQYGDCYIIIDSGPVQLLADTLVMAELVDGIVLVVKLGHTKKSMLKKTAETLGVNKIVGVVLNYCDLSVKVYKQYHNYYDVTRKAGEKSSASHKE